jgi:hypothetical protein
MFIIGRKNYRTGDNISENLFYDRNSNDLVFVRQLFTIEGDSDYCA